MYAITVQHYGHIYHHPAQNLNHQQYLIFKQHLFIPVLGFLTAVRAAPKQKSKRRFWYEAT
jgi:hypothetical protein